MKTPSKKLNRNYFNKNKIKIFKNGG